MKLGTLSYQDIPQFSDFDQRYAQRDQKILDLIPFTPDQTGIQKKLSELKKRSYDRSGLVTALHKQYDTAGIIERSELIDALSYPTTFTVTTAHQLNLLTGPLYVIYKIASAIKLAKRIQENHPDIHVIPVYVLGTEDHDFDEINHVHIFKNTFTWEQETEAAAGEWTTELLVPLIQEILETTSGSEFSQQYSELIHNAFDYSDNYPVAVTRLINSLFAHHDLLIVDMYTAHAKKHMIQILQDDIIEERAFHLTKEQIAKQEQADLKIQAPPRERNTFYLDGKGRTRITREENHYTVGHTLWTADQLREEIKEHPEHFSPNVILRPLMQEQVLPNIAYVGGGGELAYWIELVDLFSHYDVSFPVLIRRKSHQFIDERTSDKMAQLNLSDKCLFNPIDDTIKRFLHSQSDVDLSIPEEKKIILTTLDKIIERAAAVDPTLAKSLRAEKTRWDKNLNQLEGRLMRAEKSKQEQSVKQIERIVERLLPNGSLQERHDNITPYLLKYGLEIIDKLVEISDPLDHAFSVIRESSEISV